MKKQSTQSDPVWWAILQGEALQDSLVLGGSVIYRDLNLALAAAERLRRGKFKNISVKAVRITKIPVIVAKLKEKK